MTSYTYSKGSLLNSPQNYMYSPYLGATFVSDWLSSRSSYLDENDPLLHSLDLDDYVKCEIDDVCTENVLTKICVDLRTGVKTSDCINYWLPRFLKKFEVNKRLYQYYNVKPPHRMIADSGFDNLNLYLLLAEALIRVWAIKPRSQYISGLLKIVDTLLSQIALLTKNQSSHLAWIVLAESIILDRIFNNLNLKKNNTLLNGAESPSSLSFLDFKRLSPVTLCSSDQTANVNVGNETLEINKSGNKKILLLCGHTARSVAYIQALSKEGIVPAEVIVYGLPKAKLTSSRVLNHVSDSDLFSPDFDKSVLQSLRCANWNYSSTDASELNDCSLLALVETCNPDLIIYSGYGGQLVPASLINKYAFLHIHSGWLPNYRGSTTLYYQIIDEGACAASAILLDEQIDTGSILARKRYPVPEQDVDVDYFYDSMIRADLLVETVKRWVEPINSWEAIHQQQHSLPYFIIHPLLKHLALLVIDKEKVDL